MTFIINNLDRIRHSRNIRLSACDWTQIQDAPIDAAKKQQWQIYRQALRDITLTLPDPLPDNYRPTWPKMPD